VPSKPKFGVATGAAKCTPPSKGFLAVSVGVCAGISTLFVFVEGLEYPLAVAVVPLLSIQAACGSTTLRLESALKVASVEGGLVTGGAKSAFSVLAPLAETSFT
jgi:hypothetical protein